MVSDGSVVALGPAAGFFVGDVPMGAAGVLAIAAERILQQLVEVVRKKGRVEVCIVVRESASCWTNMNDCVQVKFPPPQMLISKSNTLRIGVIYFSNDSPALGWA